MQEKNNQRIFQGVVVSDKMQKTIVVKVERLVMHPKYKKRYHVSRRYKVHDEKNEYHMGDRVMFCETRPLSKDKRWRVIERKGQTV
ncbi:30S ribosomal protein S17 [Candidatus Uhrbacteria bacterium]|nr:30S ribosomal protein S17 [Candidatus Uhrbacteria bacterium]